MKNSCQSGLFAAYFLRLFFAFSLLPFAAKSQKPALGGNLHYLNYWTPTQYFTDWMKQAHERLTCPDNPFDASCDATIARDADGWPTEPFSVLIKNPFRPEWAGAYTLKFEGFAALDAFDAGTEITGQTFDPATGQTTATIHVPASAARLVLAFRAPMSAAVRRIRLVPAGVDPDDFPTFRPFWLDQLGRFERLRFMNWTVGFADPNDGGLWKNRRKTTDWSQSGPRGAAWEHVVELANALETDLWLNVPVRADDEYLDSLAHLLKAQLKPNLKICLEHGNEIWAANWMSNFNAAAASAEVAAGGSNLNFDNSTDSYRWAMRRNARRTKQIGDRFEAVFGPGSRGTRLFPTLTYQTVSPQYSLFTQLDFLEKQFAGPISNHVSGIAAAPYLSVSSFPTGAAATTADVLVAFEQKIAAFEAGYPRFLEEGFSMARWRDLDFSWYEGGATALQGATAPPASVVCEALKSPDMEPILADYLQKWFAFGAKNAFYWFVAGASDWCEGDFYGILFSENQAATPATAALDAVLAAPALAPTVGQAAPGCIDARADVSRAANWEQLAVAAPLFVGQSKTYLVRSEADGVFSVRLVAATHPTISGQVELGANGATIGQWAVPIGSLGQKDTTLALVVPLKKGVNAVRIRFLNQQPGADCLLFSDPLLGENEAAATATELKILPNPATDFLTLEGQKAPFSWRILDATGRCVRSGGAFSAGEKIEVAGLPSGLFWLEARGETGNSAGRFLKI